MGTAWARRLTPLCAVLGLLASRAWADRRELTAALEVAPALVRIDDPLTGASSSTALGGSASIILFYGLTHEIHLGGTLCFRTAPDVVFRDQAITLPDGSRPRGDFYENAHAVTAGALLHLRWDTGEDFAPFARLEIGGGYLSYTNLAHYPSGAQLSISLPNVQEFALTGRVSVGIEYRFLNRFVGAVALAVRHNFNALSVWQFDLPCSMGVVW